MQKYNSYDLTCICSAPINQRQTIITKHDCEMILHHPVMLSIEETKAQI